MKHSEASLGARHPIHNWEYANQAAREGATGFVAADVTKVAKQLDDDSLWVLEDTTPTWGPLGGDPFSGDHNDLTNKGTNTHAQIDSHIGSTSNPHSVTAVQAGADPAGSAAGVQSNLTTHINDTANPHSTTINNIEDKYEAYAEEDASDTTTATGFVQALRLTTASLVAGATYEISWSFEVKNDTLNGVTRTRVQLDDTTDLAFADVPIAIDTTVEMPVAGFVRLQPGTGTHTIDIDFYPLTGTTAEIRRKRISIRRVS